eukprot:CAMPEP_0177604510 /NCGR_PEP_ID=MMETSP0419_2-20121207/16161_1 /TAXON_ID=582737 /ORGANISM="Tetraselmis sp., Strain GSL018" /LENGTH=131 /DNA_ID=CAMNT_0019098507 /DNA_START=496 /DNA_END=892 /DNA_ORIENTATION=-
MASRIEPLPPGAPAAAAAADVPRDELERVGACAPDHGEGHDDYQDDGYAAGHDQSDDRRRDPVRVFGSGVTLTTVPESQLVQVVHEVDGGVAVVRFCPVPWDSVHLELDVAALAEKRIHRASPGANVEGGR